MPKLDLATGAVYIAELPEPIIPVMEYEALKALVGDRLRLRDPRYQMKTQMQVYALLTDNNETFSTGFFLLLDVVRRITFSQLPKDSLLTVEGQSVFSSPAGAEQQSCPWGEVSFSYAAPTPANRGQWKSMFWININYIYLASSHNLSSSFT
jgi:hypothetical protein